MRSPSLRTKLVVPPLLLLLLLVLAIVIAPRTGVLGQVPEQPLTFPHNTHVRQADIECAFCHRTAAREAQAGIPSVEQCLFCHRVVPTGEPEMEARKTALESGAPIELINWVRVHRLPDSVHFVHQPHIRAGLTCETCHGKVSEMRQVRQVRSLGMGDCLGCHRERSAPTECSICHY